MKGIVEWESCAHSARKLKDDPGLYKRVGDKMENERGNDVP